MKVRARFKDPCVNVICFNTVNWIGSSAKRGSIKLFVSVKLKLYNSLEFLRFGCIRLYKIYKNSLVISPPLNKKFSEKQTFTIQYHNRNPRAPIKTVFKNVCDEKDEV